MADRSRQLLSSGLAELNLSPSTDVVDALLDYLGLMQRWNQAYNLTAVRDPEAMVIRHLLDSLAIVPLLNGQRIIDVGTGPGIPGVILALMYPDRYFALLDANGKKTRFLFQVKSQLGLSNISIVEERVEHYQPAQTFDAVVSRAFASLSRMVAGCRHLLDEGGRFYAMKAASVAEELAELTDDVELVAQHTLEVPHLNEPRSLVELRLTRRPGQS